MEISINLEDVKEFVESLEFANFLLENTTEFSTAAFILQILLEKIEELEKAN